MGYTDQVRVEYDDLIKELEIFIEVLQRDFASMVRTQEQAAYVLNCPAPDHEKTESLQLMRIILVAVAGSRLAACEKMGAETDRLTNLLLKFNESRDGCR
jgi:hypothetical protein